MGVTVIKGSEKTLEEGLQTTWLSLSKYMNLSARSRTQEGDLSSFRSIMRARRDRDYDAADRTQSTLCEMRENGVSGKELGFLYVNGA
ncbi:unnamed protein product [Peniophora sp. CBMAI 1063]|nr:unnamed protein product [Peniophora sp. CBMAI 1063]